MKNELTILYKKYKELFWYAVFGVLTTIVNILVYKICYDVFQIPNVPSNIIAWVFSVTFAFITNKLWVFGSKDRSYKTIARELGKFTLARLNTLFVDLLIMWITVDILHLTSTTMNICSKLFVFKK